MTGVQTCALPICHKEAKCEMEKLNGELSETYTKVRFLEQEVVPSQWQDREGLHQEAR